MNRGRYSRLQRRRQATPIKRMTRNTQLTPTQSPQQNAPQGHGNYGQPTSQTTTTTRELPKEKRGTLLQDVMLGKEAVDDISKGYEEGQKVQSGLLSGWDTAKDYADQAVTGMSDWYNGTNTLTSLNQLPDNGSELLSQMGGERVSDMFSTPNVVDPVNSTGLYSTGIEVNPASSPIDEALTGGGQKFTEAGQSVPGMQTGYGNMPNATFGNAVTGLGNAYAMGSGLASGNWGQGIGGAMGLAMMTNPATLPFAWLPAIGGGILDDWF